MQIALSTDSNIENSQQSVLFDAFLLFIFCHDVIICGTAASLVNVSASHLLIFFALSILLQVYRHSYMASYSIYNIHTR